MSRVSFDLRSRQAGSVAVMAALLMVVLVGFCAFVLDIGTVFATRRALQNSADAAALAAAKELQYQLLSASGDPAGAARTWASKNGVRVDGGRCTTDGTATVTASGPDASRPNSWRVETSQLVRLTFAPVIGIKTMCATASAVAVVTNGAVAKIFPWSLYGQPANVPYAKPGTIQTCDPQDVGTNPYCFVLKDGADGSASGNFGILNFLCTGSPSDKSNNYVYWAKYGYGSRSGEVVPRVDAAAQPPQEWTVCTFTGNTSSANDDIRDWVVTNTRTPPPTCPQSRNQPNYVPDFRCPLIGLLPILKEGSLGTGSSGNVTIVKFAVFELVGLTQDQNGVGHQQIVGQFLQWAAAVGPTQPQSANGQLNGAVTIRLVQ
jgi:Flp pilus assembly protein TadG